MSVASQTFRNFEHIIVDGASGDNTLSIARSYPETRILSEKDNGLYDAMNKGIRLARGKYLLFLNAGDTFHSKDILAAYAARARRGDDIIYADTVIVDSARHIIGRRHLTAPASLTFESFARGMLVCHQAFMVRREIAPDYDLQYRFSADYDWTVRCIKNADPRRCLLYRHRLPFRRSHRQKQAPLSARAIPHHDKALRSRPDSCQPRRIHFPGSRTQAALIHHCRIQPGSS